MKPKNIIKYIINAVGLAAGIGLGAILYNELMPFPSAPERENEVSNVDLDNSLDTIANGGEIVDERESQRQRLLGLADSEGDQLFTRDYMLNDILDNNRVDDAITLAGLGFDEQRIWLYLNSNYDMNFAIELSQIKDNNENSIFSPYYILRCAADSNSNINFIEFAGELVSLEDEEGNTIFNFNPKKTNRAYMNEEGEKVAVEYDALTPHLILNLYQEANENGIETSRLLSLIRTLISFMDNEGKVIYDNPLYIANLIRDNITNLDAMINLVREYTSLTTHDGKTIFSNGRELNEVLKLEAADFETVRRLTELTNPNGETVFVEDYVIRFFLEDRGAVEYAQRLAEAGYSGRQIVAFNGLGLTPEQIINLEDTELPNFLLTLPVDDRNFSFYRTTEQWKDVLPSYDTFVIFVDEEGDIYHAIETIPNIELLSLGGHGTKTHIRLSYGHEELGDQDREEFMIDISDSELERYLARLSPNAVISVDACDTALGGRNHHNLFRFIVNLAGGRTVIGGNGEINPLFTELISAYPLNRRYHDSNENDITVIANGRSE